VIENVRNHGALYGKLLTVHTMTRNAPIRNTWAADLTRTSALFLCRASVFYFAVPTQPSKAIKEQPRPPLPMPLGGPCRRERHLSTPPRTRPWFVQNLPQDNGHQQHTAEQNDSTAGVQNGLRVDSINQLRRNQTADKKRGNN